MLLYSYTWIQGWPTLCQEVQSDTQPENQTHQWHGKHKGQQKRKQDYQNDTAHTKQQFHNVQTGFLQPEKQVVCTPQFMKLPSVTSFSYLYGVFSTLDATDSSALQCVPAFDNACKRALLAQSCQLPLQHLGLCLHLQRVWTDQGCLIMSRHVGNTLQEFLDTVDWCAFGGQTCTPAETVDLVSLQGRHEELLPVMN